MEFVPYGGQDKIKLGVSIVQNLVAVKTKSGKTCSEQDAIKFMAMCQAKRLNPFEGDAFLIGYDGKDGPTFSLITAHQTYLKRAELHPEFDGMKSGIIIERNGEMMDVEGDFYLPGDKVLGGWATVMFKNRKQPMHKRLRLQRFQKPFGVWQDDAAGMICKCAEADALRSSFPTMLGGLYMKEELEARNEKPVVSVSKPLFGTKPVNGILEAPPSPELDSEPPTLTAPPDTKGQMIALRQLCDASGVTESQVVNFLIELGTSGEDTASFDDLSSETLAMLANQWQDISNRIKEQNAN